MHYFVDHILDELEGGFFPCAINVIFDAPDIAHAIFTAIGEARQLWIGGDSTHSMTRHLNLGDDGHKAILRIADDLTNLILRVEASIATAIPFGTPCTDLRQARIFLDLNAPALVFGQVPVELINLEKGDDIDVLLHLFDREEVTADIDHHATIFEGWLILNTDSWDRPGCRGECADLLSGLYLSGK